MRLELLGPFGGWLSIDHRTVDAAWSPKFGVLVGVALTATTSDDAGNLAVHPRTHKTVLSLARRSEHRIRDLHYSKHDFGSSPLQLRFAVGDVARARAGIDFLRCVCDL